MDEDENRCVSEGESQPFRELSNLSPQVEDMDKKSKRSSNGDSGCESLPCDKTEFGETTDRKKNAVCDKQSGHSHQPMDQLKNVNKSKENQLSDTSQSMEHQKSALNPSFDSDLAHKLSNPKAQLMNNSSENHPVQPLDVPDDSVENDLASNPDEPMEKPDGPKIEIKSEPMPEEGPANKAITVKQENPDPVEEDECIPEPSTSKAADYPIYNPPSKVRRRNDGNKVKVETTGRQTPELKRKTAVKREAVTYGRCNYCQQKIDDKTKCVALPEGALGEMEAMMYGTIKYKEEDSIDERPTVLITDYTIYCKKGHLCPIDTGIMESNGTIYVCGRMKSVGASDEDGGVPVKNVGPLGQWFIIGYDKEDEAEIGVSSEFCIGLLGVPSDHYAPMMKSFDRKIFLSKQMVEYILEHLNEDSQYEEMLEHLVSVKPPEGMEPITQEELIHHAQFLFDRVEGIIENDEECTPMLQSTCVTHLMKLAGMLDNNGTEEGIDDDYEEEEEEEEKPSKKQKPEGQKKKKKQQKHIPLKKHEPTKATVTPLVEQVFIPLFNEQMMQCDPESPSENIKAARCGLCDNCMERDCGSCGSCRTMIRFGGHSTVDDVVCEKRICVNSSPCKTTQPSRVKTRTPSRTFKLCGQRLLCTQYKTYYNSCEMVEKLGDGWKSETVSTIEPGSFVMLTDKDKNKDRVIARVQALYFDKEDEESYCHVQYFIRATSSVLGMLADPHELLFTKKCEDVCLDDIRVILDVKYHVHPGNWRSLGGTKPAFPKCTGQKQFFFQKMYTEETCRFEDIPSAGITVNPGLFPFMCCICMEEANKERKDQVTLSGKINTVESKTFYSEVSWGDLHLLIGSCVYVETSSSSRTKSPEDDTEEDYDPERYPEKCRKKNSKAEKVMTGDPFSVARVVAIITVERKTHDRKASTDVKLQLARFYRPEDTCFTDGCFTDGNKLDSHLLFWSEDTFQASLEDVQGKCWVRPAAEVAPSPFKWCIQGPNRFYYEQCFAKKTKKITEIEKSKIEESTSDALKQKDQAYEWPTLPRKLQALDVFAGCGGLSLGFHQSGVAETKWAIEFDHAAAQAFKLNNPGCVMLQEDCNKLLALMLQGKTHTVDGLSLPQKHQVDLLCGGPPCQGFSGMNRFNTLAYSCFKNSLIVTYLSYCDFLRPRYFLLENVRNLVAYNKNIVIKMLIKSLLTMGYQVTFGVMQAGSYGVPQTRRRVFILAAAPGEVLPKFPEPTHSFNIGATSLQVTIDDNTYKTNCEWSSQAPLRCVTVWDALSDLPQIETGASKNQIKYGKQPTTTFQKLMRLGCGEHLYDHTCKEMSALVNARMALIPPKLNADWRDLPNIRMKLSNGDYTEKLEYKYDSFEGKLPNGAKRGVCPCAKLKSSKCGHQEATIRQSNTLIPWCLPHTANKYNQWSGLYGRLNWDGIFSTTVTNPEPMGKQGRVLHPEQHRLVSVRECARSQGFPDSYKFYGEILDRHRQIGNAVPPPLACAIGREILKALLKDRHLAVTYVIVCDT